MGGIAGAHPAEPALGFHVSSPIHRALTKPRSPGSKVLTARPSSHATSSPHKPILSERSGRTRLRVPPDKRSARKLGRVLGLARGVDASTESGESAARPPPLTTGYTRVDPSPKIFTIHILVPSMYLYSTHSTFFRAFA
jgi:hypothetical protein